MDPFVVTLPESGTAPPIVGWRGRPIDGVRVIAVCGAARHGKDQLAKYLLARVPGAERFAFSDGVAALLRANGKMRRRDPMRLQAAGMAVRNSSHGAWLDVLYGAIDDRRPPLAVITGVRFADEAAMVRQMGGRLIRVVRLSSTGMLYVSPDRDPHHAAERDIETLSADEVVTIPDGRLDLLEAVADRLVASL